MTEVLRLHTEIGRFLSAFMLFSVIWLWAIKLWYLPFFYLVNTSFFLFNQKACNTAKIKKNKKVCRNLFILGYGIVLKASLVQLTWETNWSRDRGVTLGSCIIKPIYWRKKGKRKFNTKKKERNCKENLKDYALWDGSKGLLPRQKLFFFFTFIQLHCLIGFMPPTKFWNNKPVVRSTRGINFCCS